MITNYSWHMKNNNIVGMFVLIVSSTIMIYDPWFLVWGVVLLLLVAFLL